MRVSELGLIGLPYHADLEHAARREASIDDVEEIARRYSVNFTAYMGPEIQSWSGGLVPQLAPTIVR